MNHTEKKYAIERVNGIKANKLAALEGKFTSPSRTIKDTEKIALVRSGKVKMFPNSSMKLDYYLSLEKIFDFSKYDYPAVLDKKKYSKSSMRIIKKTQEISDKIMLGSAEEALAMIAELESM